MEEGDGIQVKNVFIPLAKHILLENGATNASYSFEDKTTPVGSQHPTAYTINLRSFLTNGNISITSNNGAFHFGGGATSKSFNVGANACASANGSGNCGSGTLGKIENYSITVYFTPTACGTNSGTITISDGTSTATVTLSGIGYPFFDFSASAVSSKQEFGSTTASVAQSRIIGQTTSTSSASTTATFTATPSSGCTFNGWYENPSYTGTPISTSATYQTTITNNTVNSTASKTLYAKFKKNQTLSWNNSFDTNTIINGTTQANPATASSGLAVSYTSSNTNAITVDTDGTLHGVSLGKSTITASQAGNDDYNPATSISREFSVLDKLQPAFVPSFSGTQAAMKVGETATITLANVTDGFSISAGTTGVVSWSRSDNTITLTALKEGSTTLTLDEPGNAITNPVAASYTVTVSKVENTLAIDMASLETTVGGTLAVTFSGQNNMGTPIQGTVSNQVLSSTINNGTNVISYSNGTVTALNAGTATITFTQAATDKYTAVQKSFDVSVTKNGNSISIVIDGTQRNSINLGRNASVPFSYSSESDAPYSVTMTSGSESIASLSGSNIATHNSDGTVIWSISQPETYKYEAASTSLRVKVNSTPEEEGYVLVHNDDLELNTIQTGPSLALSGPGNILSFDASRAWNLSGTSYLVVEISTNGGNSFVEWQRPNLGTSTSSHSYVLPDGATHVRFKTITGATLITHVKNIKVTRKTYVRASSDKTDLGTVNTGSTATATINVDWSSTNGGDIAIESSNPCFTANPASITGTANKDGKTAITVTYTPDPAKLGADAATITVSDLFYSQELTLTATATKQGTSITANYESSAASSLKVEGCISNAFKFSGVSSATPSESPDADFYYVIDHHVSGNAEGSSDPDKVISYDSASNTITALNAGTATITIHQKNTALYSATNASFEFTVAKHDQTIVWDNELSDLTLKKGQSLETNTATASSGLAVSYSSANTLSITVDAESGALTAVGAGADVEIIASQAGNYKFNQASISRKFTVFAQATPVFTPAFEGSGTSILVDGATSITVSDVSDGLDSGFSVSADKEGIISWMRDGNTITITGIGEGSVTLTLSQQGNDDFLAKTENYTITVVLPDDYAVIKPENGLPQPGNYRKITLSRTIPAGLNTIALPFVTNIAELTKGSSNSGAELYTLVNVGYDSAKGYKFYFKKVASGVISAGVPYVIFLENDVVNPVWQDENGIEIKAEESMSSSMATVCGAWKFESNFTAQRQMKGLYGVVNSLTDDANPSSRINKIMKGGENAVINACNAVFSLSESITVNAVSVSATGTDSTKAPTATQKEEGIVLFTIPRL